MSLVNIGPQDAAIQVTQALPPINSSVTTPVIDLMAIAPHSDAWRIGRFALTFPNLPENSSGTGITVALQAANASLTNSPAAPGLPLPAAFAAPAVAQTLTVAAVAAGGSTAQVYYMIPAFDANGNTYQFYNFVITTPSGVTTLGEPITIAWEYA